MGRSPQRAARLYFRTTCFPGEDAHGPGSCEHRGPRAGRTGESFTKWRRESWRLTNWPGSKPVTTNGSAEGSGRAIARSICGASAATSNFSGNVTCDLSNFPCVETSDVRSSDALQLTGSDAPPEGWEIIPTYDAKCLVAYMMALNQSHPLKEVKSAGAAPAASPAASPSAAPGGQPPPK